MTNQHQRAAIVTGGSRGIGAAIARRLARDGIAVAINYASGRDAADALVAEIEAAGGRASPCRPISPIQQRRRGCSTRPSKPSAASTSSSTMPA